MTSSDINFSVALCTCDGIAHLKEQIASLYKQSYLPSELTVCDDASVDNTVSLIESLSTDAPFPIRIHKNKNRIGVRENFEQVIKNASGNIIALCDQDDVWLPEKLETFEKAFEDGADWVCCDAEVVNEKLVPLNYTLWQRTNFNSKEREQARQGDLFSVLLKHYTIAGATIAFRANLREKLLPIPENWHYDAWIAAVLAATSKGAIIELPLQRYRQHSTNIIGGLQRNLLSESRIALSINRDEFYDEELMQWSQLAERLKSIDASPEAQSRLAEKINHLKRRAEWPQRRIMRLPGIITEIVRGGYARFSRNWGSIAIDLLLK